MYSVAAILDKAESLETEDLIAAAKGISVETPLGSITYRGADHQSTHGRLRRSHGRT